ncbi:MAG TPA: hypothetical protein VH597_13570 [Verrucomicrobiae bacterium]|nr:hypothetical protein [Verrucomicrobiae bacterium]
MIHEQCRVRGIILEQFEDAVGWRLSPCIEAPEKSPESMSVDGLQCLARELSVDWHRVI